MRGFVSSMVAGVLLGGAVWTHPVSPAFAASVAPSEEADPAELYDQGRKAYRLGDFEDAVTKWERAYELSDRPLLLYNISLAYKGLYGITKDIADLRRARAVLDNFIKLAEADPELEVDDAHERLAELDAMIADVERPTAVATPSDQGAAQGVEPPAGHDPIAPAPTGKDPGKTYRYAGIGLMAAGGALVLTAVALVSYYSVRGQQFETDLRSTYDQATMEGCDLSMSYTMGRCGSLVENIRIYRKNGQEANRGSILSLGIAGGLGVASLATGAALYVLGKRRTSAWQNGLSRHQLQLQWSRQGVSLSGRF